MRRNGFTRSDQVYVVYTGMPTARSGSYFMSTRDGHPEIYVMEADGENQNQADLHGPDFRRPATRGEGEGDEDAGESPSR